MPIFRALGIAFLSLAMPVAASAAPPKVQGVYASLQWHLCQTVIAQTTSSVSKVGNSTTAPAVVDVNFGPQTVSKVEFVTTVGHSDFPGVTGVSHNLNAGTPNGASAMISMSVGTVTFPVPAASSGQATAKQTEVLGHALRFSPAPGIPGDNAGIGRHVNGAQSASFSLTETTATIGGKVWDITVGDIQNGVARTINMLRRPGANDYCIDSMTLTKQ